jgi:multicomponent Na+:H+ antiporter subunit F
MLGIYSYVKESVFFMDVALVLAVISFVGTLTIAKYLDEGVVF